MSRSNQVSEQEGAMQIEFVGLLKSMARRGTELYRSDGN